MNQERRKRGPSPSYKPEIANAYLYHNSNTNVKTPFDIFFQRCSVKRSIKSHSEDVVTQVGSCLFRLIIKQEIRAFAISVLSSSFSY